MKLKEIVLAGSLLLLTSLAFSQDKLKFDVYSKGEGRFSLRLNNSTLKVDSNEIDFSFLLGFYSMKFKKLTDSTYQEIVKNNVPFQSKDEFFNYSFKDSCYTLLSYYAVGGKPRAEKKALVGRDFDDKYRSLPELVNYFEKGLIKDGDSIHFIINGEPYSVEIGRRENQDSVIYSCSLEEIIKREPGDVIIFPYPIEAYATKENGGLIPLRFSTAFLNVRNGKKTSIEGELRGR